MLSTYDQNHSTTDAVAERPVGVFEPASLNKIIVVGSGPVGMRFVDELLRRQPNAHIHLFGNEPFQPYNRVLLSSLLSGEKKPEELKISMPSMKAHPYFSYTFAAIKHIDTNKKCVEDSLGNTHSYDQLMLAMGARAHIPNIPGNQAHKVYTFRNMQDTQALYSRLASARHIVVVGGGVLGIEAAKGLSQLKTKVTLIHQGSRLMNRQLDDEAANMLEQKIQDSGIQVITHSGVREIYEDGRVTGVRIYSGDEIECDTVLLSVGIRPNVELARLSGLKTAKGVVVNDGLRTSCDDIYAIGECSEHRGKTYGLVAPGLEQAAIAADVLTGGTSVYLGSTTISRLKVIDEDVINLGEVSDLVKRPHQHEICFRQRNNNIYRKLVVHKGVVIGAVGYGHWPEFTRVQELFQSKRTVWLWQLLWFWITGRLWLLQGADDVKQWPAAAIVCQCNQVTQGELLHACAKGCDSVEQLCTQTRAGTTCGSCKPLLAQLVGKVQEKRHHWQWLITCSVFAVCAVMAIAFIPQAQVSETVQTSDFFETIWNDPYWKQVTGFSVLSMVVIGMLMSLRKRLHWAWIGSFSGWRFAHMTLGALCTLFIVFHTGFHLGENLNRLLMVTFLAVLVMGSIAGFVTGLSHTLRPSRAQRVQKTWNFLHVFVAWPLPILLIVLILTVYFF
jgi:nitrite reductase (NADH) large subunit